ncbi:Transcriptional regulator, AraC family protein [Flavobacterium psychrophilum]|uniref:helix-turn-helix domain-containing protein n=1 Tax=Flavobacterium psychrophilum TaxID=96345 RepID=UPI000B7C2EFD|nr:AraC family transcriptional regulator [Flavobacterium psychrophilum]ELY2010651.1 helix-turn-helix transcriptional regulator [Flavobacterium psychrophilum]SNB25279.1 Transcriptional regulator, AraC family protein [Flavobacterium psychrophilum]
MPIENIPEIYIQNKKANLDLLVYDFKMTNDVVKSKVNLSMNMFSFLQVGKKHVHFADTSVAVNSKQSLLLKKGNWLWTELLDTEAIYYCKLFFFSEEKLTHFLSKHTNNIAPDKDEIPYFVIENDNYIAAYLDTLSILDRASSDYSEQLLSVKFEEIMLYLLYKYGRKFEFYLHSLISKEISPFKKVVESNVYLNLKLEEIAFLCNMSLSTFKRHFTTEYNEAPGKWLQEKRLQRAKEILQEGQLKPSDIYLDMGYNNLSNFSIAFKNKFNISPKNISSKPK